MHPFTKDHDVQVKVASLSVDGRDFDVMSRETLIIGVALLSVVSIIVLLLGRISSGI